jgi:hypothetical protein
MLQYMDTVLGFAIVMLLLSLLVTALVQMLIAMAGTRSQALHWGLQRLLQQADLDVSDVNAKAIAKAVLKHPSITTNAYYSATAIRYEELSKILQALKDHPTKELKGKSSANKALRKIMTKASTDTPQMKPVVETLKAELKRSFPMHTDLVSDTVNRALATQQKVMTDVRTWFDTIMDRTADRFVMHTRIVTGTMAVALVLVLQIDSVSIFQQLVANPDLRTKLVQSSQSILDKAEEMQAFENNRVQAASQALSAVITDPNYPALNTLPDVPADLATFNQGSRWVRGLADVNETQSTELMDLFDKRFREQSQTAGQSMKTATQEIATYLEESQLDLFAASWLVHDQPGQPMSYRDKCKRGIGLFMSMIFLGLGAPFWYNILSQLSTLRPLIAGKIEAKPEG